MKQKKENKQKGYKLCTGTGYGVQCINRDSTWNWYNGVCG